MEFHVEYSVDFYHGKSTDYSTWNSMEYKTGTSKMQDLPQ